MKKHLTKRAWHPLTPEHRRKLSLSRMGHPVSDETRRKIAAAITGKKYGPCSPEHRAKIAAAHLGKEKPWAHRPDSTHESTHRGRMRRAVPVVEICALGHIGGCHGRLDRAHVDRNFLNDDPANILTLCRSHHFLYDNGRIDLSNPVMPPFTISSGKRRYKYGSDVPYVRRGAPG